MNIDKLIGADHHINMPRIAKQVNPSVGTGHNIVRKELKYRKICAHWIPHSLSEQQKTVQLQTSQKCLVRYYKEENVFLDRIITGDETWCHRFIPLSKQASMTWKHEESPRSMKVRHKDEKYLCSNM